MKKIPTYLSIIISILVAAFIGIVFKEISKNVKPDSQAINFIDIIIQIGDFMGNIFMRALKMIIVPLVVSSVIAGISSLAGMERLKQIGLKTISFYLISTLLATTVGLLSVNLIKPGVSKGEPNAIIRNAFKDEANNASKNVQKKFTESQQDKAKDWKSLFYRMLPTNIISASSDNGGLLGVLVFSLIFAITMTAIPRDEMTTLRTFFISINDVMIKITKGIMFFAPFGIFGMILKVTYNTGGEFFIQMLPYMVTVLLALSVHMFITLPLILKFIGNVNPIKHFMAMRTAILTAFATASSSSTLPVTMRCVQDKAGVSKKTASFTLPIGSTVNMDGTALYECVAVVFVAQIMGLELSIASQIGIVFAALLTSIGVAGIPSASMVAILIIMKNVNIPGAEMAVYGLLAVDRILDMSRTSVNIFGDSCAAVIIDKSENNKLIKTS